MNGGLIFVARHKRFKSYIDQMNVGETGPVILSIHSAPIQVVLPIFRSKRFFIVM
jgi:hypothetical protein